MTVLGQFRVTCPGISLLTIRERQATNFIIIVRSITLSQGVRMGTALRRIRKFVVSSVFFIVLSKTLTSATLTRMADKKLPGRPVSPSVSSVPGPFWWVRRLR